MPAAPIVDIDVARQLYAAGREFCVTLKFRGQNSNNSSGWSDKWWQITWDGKSGLNVQVNHGKTGTKGRKHPYEWTFQKANLQCRKKLVEGYIYSSNTVHQIPKPPKVVVIRLIGVFAEIRGVTEIGPDHFEAYDEQGLYMFDLTEDGARQVAAADTFRITLTTLR